MGILMDFEAVCPVDGTRFTYGGTASFSIFGHALDGLPHGSWMFPLKLAQCPACRFPVEIGVLDDEKTALARSLVEGPTYRQAAETETPYRLLYLVMEALDIGTPRARLDQRLKATWQTYGDRERYGRYARELGQAMDGQDAAFRADHPQDWAVFSSFVANVERQAGDWKAAAERLDRIEAAAIAADGVAERIALTRRLIADGDLRPHFLER